MLIRGMLSRAVQHMQHKAHVSLGGGSIGRVVDVFGELWILKRHEEYSRSFWKVVVRLRESFGMIFESRQFRQKSFHP